MLIPFLPYLIALAGLTAVLGAVAEPALGPAFGPGSLPAALVLYAALPLLGALVGSLPERWLGGRRQAGLRRRGLFLIAWLWVLIATALPAALVALLGGGGAEGGGTEAAMAALLVNFWIGDTLALRTVRPMGGPPLREQLRDFGRALRMPLPILVLMLGGLAAPVLTPDLPLYPNEEAFGLPWLRLAGSLGAMLLVAVVAVPVLVRWCWGLAPLPAGPGRDVVEAELAANGVRVAAVLAWPESIMASATAGVIGLLPRFRYLLMSPALVTALTADELRSVTAHEAAHVRHRHLWYFLAAIIGFVLLMQLVLTALFWAGLFAGELPPLWLSVVLEVVALVAFFRFGIGFVSRQFERQADSEALRRQGAAAMDGALHKVAMLNGIPPQVDNWHHYGITRRVHYAYAATEEPARLARHDGKVRRVKLALVGVLAAGIGAQALLFSPASFTYLGEQYLRYRMTDVRDAGAQDLLALKFLASRAVAREDHATAERYFRLVLQVTPEDPQALNNLAWVIVTRPGASASQLREGLRLAESAADAGAQAYIWDTLAESYFRLARYDAAIDAASRALALARQGHGRGDVPLHYYRERLAAFSRHGQGA